MKYIHLIANRDEEYLTDAQLNSLESAFLVYKDCYPFAFLYPNTWKNLPDYFIKVNNLASSRDILKAMACYLYGGLFIDHDLYANLDIRESGNTPIITKKIIYTPEKENPTLGYILTKGVGWSKMKIYTKYFLDYLPENHLSYLRGYYDYGLQ
ncbi:MAG: hypothetical protein ACRCU6_08795 [Fusobacteriaceae bacterium]